MTTATNHMDTIERRPGEWYVIGHLYGRKWMPMSGPYKTGREAEKTRTHLLRAERAAKAEFLKHGLADRD